MLHSRACGPARCPTTCGATGRSGGGRSSRRSRASCPSPCAAGTRKHTHTRKGARAHRLRSSGSLGFSSSLSCTALGTERIYGGEQNLRAEAAARAQQHLNKPRIPHTDTGGIRRNH
eukprot:14789127-Alexandrium_andersonii.AAC.1